MSKVIVITGGVSGIGKETASLLKKQGNTVVVLSKNVINNESENVFRCDVSNQVEVEKTFEVVGKMFGKIDVLINCAGYGLSGASELLPSQSVKELFEVNVLGVVNCSKSALPLMQKGAKIINISSAMAFFPLPFRTMYAASKAAVTTISYGMRMELKNFGVQVCAVCPGDVKTNFTKNRVKFFETNEKYGERINKAANSLDGKEDKRMSPVIVANAIIKQVNAKKTKHLVIVGAKYKFLYVLQKLFPSSLQLWLTDRFFGGY